MEVISLVLERLRWILDKIERATVLDKRKFVARYSSVLFC
jgi:hypothetical protein